MESFLEKTVKHLCTKYGDDISDLCIVLPNRRAGLFLKTHFSKQLNKTFWSPEILATEDFVALLSGFEIADSTTLMFELYETVKQVSGEDIESFEEFMKWGQILLSDINDIDRYLINATALFGNLKNIKELETWSLNNEEELTEFQKKYLSFWKSLGAYYTNFNQRMLDKKIAYQGLAYKAVAENTVEKVNQHPWKKIIFAGFNALNKAEEQIIEALLFAQKAEIIWDTDAYYATDNRQEAGKFIRKYFSNKKNQKYAASTLVFDDNLLAQENKKITIIGAAKNVAQAKLAGDLVADFQKENNSLENTALVLADENLLFPVLHSLPENLSDINVTMGYPLKNTPASGFFDLVIDLHLNAIKLSNGNAKYSFYYKDLLKLLNHPYCSLLVSNNNRADSLKQLTSELQEKNIVFAAHTTIQNIISEKQPEVYALLKPILTHWHAPVDAIACVYYVIDTLKNAIIAKQSSESGNTTNLELEYLFAFTKIIKRIEALMLEYPNTINDLKTFQSIFKQIVRATTLPFYGEPLMGLQVMGMLETRTLDFENLILLSCNEDVLPSGKSVNSFIPHELKKYFGLPTYADKDAIFAYHFYRLLQRAQNIYLIYNTETGVVGGGEKSRFLTQLAYELPRVNKNACVQEKIVNIPLELNANANHIEIEKTETIINRLKQLAEYGLSPSLLNKYRNCSLQFYFHAVAGIKPIDEVEETIGADVLGNAVHEVLETLYQPFVGKKINAAQVEEFKKSVESLTVSAFEKQYSKSEINYGKNLLTVKMAMKFIYNFLDVEIKAIADAEKKSQPLIIKALELPLQADIAVGNDTVKLIGKADRIDSLGSLLRIIDYKTGVANDKELQFDDWDEIRSEAELAKSFQLLIYAYLYQKMNSTITDNMVSGIITFRKLSDGLKNVKINNNEILNQATLIAFEKQLQKLLADIFNPQLHFVQTPKLDSCEYCPYKGVCKR
ncbi:MAG: PD-(D/E)XK nuclease family protein [Bacteroidia bacterium]